MNVLLYIQRRLICLTLIEQIDLIFIKINCLFKTYTVPREENYFILFVMSGVQIIKNKNNVMGMLKLKHEVNTYR